jgi:hypothetical protein
MTATIAPLPVMSIIEGFSTAFRAIFNSAMNICVEHQRLTALNIGDGAFRCRRMIHHLVEASLC